MSATPTLPTLLSQADIAMYAAKHGDKRRTVLYRGGIEWVRVSSSNGNDQ
jgi:hypothetical protein